jgi:hypothetical protein
VVNGTYPQDASLVDVCRKSIDSEWYDNVERMLREIDDVEYYNAAYILLEIIGSVDVLAEDCYEGFEDIGYKYFKWA